MRVSGKGAPLWSMAGLSPRMDGCSLCSGSENTSSHGDLVEGVASGDTLSVVKNDLIAQSQSDSLHPLLPGYADRSSFPEKCPQNTKESTNRDSPM